MIETGIKKEKDITLLKYNTNDFLTFAQNSIDMPKNYNTNYIQTTAMKN